MVDKLLAASLLATMATTGTVAISEHADELLQEANAIAAHEQGRQLRIALELYYLAHDTYPQVRSTELGPHLYDAGVLEEADLPYRLQYQVTRGGRTTS